MSNVLNRTFVAIALIAFCNCINAQDCELRSVERSQLALDSFADSVIQGINKNAPNSYHLLFYRNLGQVNKKRLYVLRVDSASVVDAYYIDAGTRNDLPKSTKLDLSISDLKNIKENGVFEGSCNSSVTFHETSRLFLIKNGKAELSVIALDGKMNTLLQSNNDMANLQKIFIRLAKVFPGWL